MWKIPDFFPIKNTLMLREEHPLFEGFKCGLDDVKDIFRLFFMPLILVTQSLDAI